VTWQSGRREVIAALRASELQQVTGGEAAGDGWITQARRKYETAQLISEVDSESAYVTAYDGARFALVGVLAQQGLRATQKGGHLAVEHAVRAQFGPSFVKFSTLRRRRAELEYPSYPGEMVEEEELLDALRTVDEIIDGAAQLLPHLSIFRDT
jgi:hypothetical protein